MARAVSEPPPMRMLVCEGRCGAAARVAYDDAADDFGAAQIGTGRYLTADPRARVIEAAGRLVHTAHWRLNAERWACGECGHERRG